jgi:hypothetical protein
MPGQIKESKHIFRRNANSRGVLPEDLRGTWLRIFTSALSLVLGVRSKLGFILEK